MCRKWIPSLRELSKTSLENLIIRVGSLPLSSFGTPVCCSFLARLEELRYTVSKIMPQTLQVEIGELLLSAVSKLSAQCPASNYKIVFVIRRLVAMFVNFKPKDLTIKKYDNRVQSELLKYLKVMEALKKLDLTTLNIDQITGLSNRLHFLTNLTHFTLMSSCTDEIIAAMSEHCKSIQSLDVSNSDDVTDNCIENILNFQMLQTVDLHETSVTSEGYLKLLTSDADLLDIGVCEFLTSLLPRINQAVKLRKSVWFQPSTEDLLQISKYFTQTVTLHLSSDIELLPDLSCLSQLTGLNEVCLSVFSFQNTGKFSALKCSVLTVLQLIQTDDDVDLQLDVSDVVNIGVNCPNLVRFEFFNCSFINGNNYSGISYFSKKPFQKLTHFAPDTKSHSLSCKYVLAHAYNLRVLHLDGVDLSDSFFLDILKVNSLQFLECIEIFPVERLSEDLLKSLISNFKRIKSVGIFSEGTTLKAIENFILAQKYDIQLT